MRTDKGCFVMTLHSFDLRKSMASSIATTNGASSVCFNTKCTWARTWTPGSRRFLGLIFKRVGIFLTGNEVNRAWDSLSLTTTSEAGLKTNLRVMVRRLACAVARRIPCFQVVRDRRQLKERCVGGGRTEDDVWDKSWERLETRGGLIGVASGDRGHSNRISAGRRWCRFFPWHGTHEILD